YWVRVSQGCGHADSATAVISVPMILATGPKGGSGETTTDGFAPITVRWQGINPPATNDSFALYALGASDDNPLKAWVTGGKSTDSFIVPLPVPMNPGP